jgi:peptidoglycan hydrolase-like protein with peptidoglycan-binding domain
MCAVHKEYALPHGRKDDPNFDMVKFRADVAAIMVEPIGKSAPVTAPAPINVQLPQATYDEGLEFLQANLVSLNYHEIGTVDGLWGGKTRGAITAFMNDRGKSPDGLTTDAGWVSQAARAIVTDEVGRAIDEGWSRPIAPSRANATAKDIAPQVEAVRQSLWQRFIAKLAGTGAGGVALVTGVGSQFGSVDAQMSPVKQYFANVPGWAWFSLIALAALAVFLSANKSQNATVKDYNTGKIN